MSAGLKLEINSSAAADLGRLEAKLAKISSPRIDRVMEGIGALVATQTKDRIESGRRRDPDGRTWPAWSPRYKRTRHRNQKMLKSRGHLLESIQEQLSFAGGTATVSVGSNVAYAATHQFGRGPIPARPYLGLSTEDAREISDTLDDWLEALAR